MWKFGWAPCEYSQPLKATLTGAYLETWLSLLGPHVWRYGTHVHTCSKHVALVGAFLHYINFIILFKRGKHLALKRTAGMGEEGTVGPERCINELSRFL